MTASQDLNKNLGEPVSRGLDDLSEIAQARLGHVFSDHSLLLLALTHSSYANEHGQVSHNERLEFLGDAVLELAVSEILYARYPESREGELTKIRARLVSQPALADLARELQLDTLLLLGRGEENQGGRERDSLLSDAMEAVLGAIFLDAGFQAAAAWIRERYAPVWPSRDPSQPMKDDKSRLQELTQERFRALPSYALVSSHGPEHAKVFEVEIALPSGVRLQAAGSSVKKAEQQAAREALRHLERQKGGE